MATPGPGLAQDSQQGHFQQTGSSASASSPQLLALHRHLTQSLLQPICPDIKLKAFNRIYSLHRIFLVQSTFFNSLLNSDFKEAKTKAGVWRRPNTSRSSEVDHSWESDEEENAVELHFDDVNITRPAFEYCLATLYGAAPTLVLPSWCCPSLEYPLTHHMHMDQSDDPIKSPSLSTTSPNTDASTPQHPATPRFLLSLIASATYLGIPSVVAQAITLILCSITPYTVSQYLRFSLGLGIVGAQEARERQDIVYHTWDWELEGPAWGLEHLSKECRLSRQNSFSASMDEEAQDKGAVQPNRPGHYEEDDDEEGKAGSNQYLASSSIHQSATDVNGDSFLPSFMSQGEGSKVRQEGRFYYGALSDKIGEACACWLLRWGADILLAEEQMQVDDDSGSYLSMFMLPRNEFPIRRGLSEEYHVALETAFSVPHPTVWCHPRLGGIPARWMRVILSSDSFWIRSEWDRYDLARRIVAMRRGGNGDDFVEADENLSDGDDLKSPSSLGAGSERERKASLAQSATESNASGFADDEDEQDEEEYSLLFSEGIYYTHMTFEELSAISNQVCPRTGSTYVPMNVLQNALWAQSELKNMISNRNKRSRDDAVNAAATASTSGDEEAEETATSQKMSSAKGAHPERELGLVSPESAFADALRGLQRRSRKSDVAQPPSSLVLGGMRPLMLLGAASKTRAVENLLDKRFYAVPTDDTVRIGENLTSLLNAHTYDPALNPNRDDLADRGGPSGIAAVIDGRTLNVAQDAKRGKSSNFFGVQNAVKSGHRLGDEQMERENAVTSFVVQREWTGYEPMRLGVEFFGVDRLKEKERMYSPSFFYAGSIWNLYLQIIKKPKGPQLGIYLHRQNFSDSLPSPSYPADMMASLSLDDTEPHTPRRREAHGASLTGSVFYTSSSPLTSNTFGMGEGGTSTPSQLHTPQPSSSRAQAPASNTRQRSLLHTPLQNQYQLTPSPTSNCIVNNDQQPAFLDQRRILRAYFSVHCPSPLGTSLTKFSSRPDNFSLSQSWGWKSSSLLGAVYLSQNKIGSAESQVSSIFRCIVTVGVV